jgi:phage-related protein
MKPLSFLGSPLEAVRAFPEAARREVGYQLDRVQRGLDPDDWKPTPRVGRGVREVRIRTTAGAFRVIYMTQVEGRLRAARISAEDPSDPQARPRAG